MSKVPNIIIAFALIAVAGVMLYFAGIGIYYKGREAGFQQCKTEGIKEAKDTLLEPVESKVYELVVGPEGVVATDGISYYKVNPSCSFEKMYGKKIVIVDGKCKALEE